eukprot:gene4051-5793_t
MDFEIEEAEEVDHEFEWNKPKKNSKSSYFGGGVQENDSDEYAVYDYDFKPKKHQKPYSKSKEFSLNDSNFSAYSIEPNEKPANKISPFSPGGVSASFTSLNGNNTSTTIAVPNGISNNSNQTALEKAQSMLNKYSNKPTNSFQSNFKNPKPIMFHEDDISLDDSNDESNQKEADIDLSDDNDPYHQKTLSRDTRKLLPVSKATESMHEAQKREPLMIQEPSMKSNFDLEDSYGSGENYDDNDDDNPLQSNLRQMSVYRIKSVYCYYHYAISNLLYSEEVGLEEEDVSYEDLQKIQQAQQNFEIKKINENFNDDHNFSYINDEDDGSVSDSNEDDEDDNRDYSFESKKDEDVEIETVLHKPKILSFADFENQTGWNVNENENLKESSPINIALPSIQVSSIHHNDINEVNANSNSKSNPIGQVTYVKSKPLAVQSSISTVASYLTNMDESKGPPDYETIVKQPSFQHDTISSTQSISPKNSHANSAVYQANNIVPQYATSSSIIIPESSNSNKYDIYNVSNNNNNSSHSTYPHIPPQHPPYPPFLNQQPNYGDIPKDSGHTSYPPLPPTAVNPYQNYPYPYPPYYPPPSLPFPYPPSNPLQSQYPGYYPPPYPAASYDRIHNHSYHSFPYNNMLPSGLPMLSHSYVSPMDMIHNSRAQPSYSYDFANNSLANRRSSSESVVTELILELRKTKEEADFARKQLADTMVLIQQIDQANNKILSSTIKEETILNNQNLYNIANSNNRNNRNDTKDNQIKSQNKIPVPLNSIQSNKQNEIKLDMKNSTFSKMVNDRYASAIDSVDEIDEEEYYNNDDRKRVSNNSKYNNPVDDDSVSINIIEERIIDQSSQSVDYQDDFDENEYSDDFEESVANTPRNKNNNNNNNKSRLLSPKASINRIKSPVISARNIQNNKSNSQSSLVQLNPTIEQSKIIANVMESLKLIHQQTTSKLSLSDKLPLNMTDELLNNHTNATRNDHFDVNYAKENQSNLHNALLDQERIIKPLRDNLSKSLLSSQELFRNQLESLRLRLNMTKSAFANQWPNIQELPNQSQSYAIPSNDINTRKPLDDVNERIASKNANNHEEEIIVSSSAYTPSPRLEEIKMEFEQQRVKTSQKLYDVMKITYPHMSENEISLLIDRFNNEIRN